MATCMSSYIGLVEENSSVATCMFAIKKYLGANGQKSDDQ